MVIDIFVIFYLFVSEWYSVIWKPKPSHLQGNRFQYSIRQWWYHHLHQLTATLMHQHSNQEVSQLYFVKWLVRQVWFEVSSLAKQEEMHKQIDHLLMMCTYFRQKGLCFIFTFIQSSPNIWISCIILIFPWNTTVDCFTIDFQPWTHLTKTFFKYWCNFSIGCWTHIDQYITSRTKYQNV